MSMYKAVGLNAKVRIFESGVHRRYNYKPYLKDSLYLCQMQHDNNAGDAGFSAYYNFSCDGNASPMCDKTVDDLISRALVATGEGRRSLWQAAFKRIHEEIIPGANLFHMVGYCRIGKRINYKPSLATNAEIPLEQITFK